MQGIQVPIYDPNPTHQSPTPYSYGKIQKKNRTISIVSNNPTRKAYFAKFSWSPMSSPNSKNPLKISLTSLDWIVLLPPNEGIDDFEYA